MKNCAVGILLSPDKKKVIATKRRDVPIWVLPGGGIEEGESPEKALVREFLEETGLNVSITRKIGEYTPINRLTRLTHLFECKVDEGIPVLTDETSGVGFFDIEDLPYPFFPLHERWIYDALNGGVDLIKKPIAGASWWDFTKAIIAHPALTLRYIVSRLGIPFNTKSKF